MAILLLLGLTAAAPPAAVQPAPEPKQLWIDWRALDRAADVAQPRAVGSVERARALGERVGQVVAAGDCRGGERMALAAGDAKLAEAVRKYCLN